MKKQINGLILLVAVIALSACNKTQFSELSPAVSAKTDIPLDPVLPIGPNFNSKLSSGLCKADSSTAVLSCLKCDVPQVKPVPQLSVKAQALVDAMFLACQVPNGSDLTNFRPTKEMLVNKLNRGSQALYPDTPRTAQMELVIQGLTNTVDSSLQKRMFGGLWYRPPYSDAFETYFGVTVQEAKSTFCWDGNIQTPNITGISGLYSKKWLDAQYGNNPGGPDLPDYILAQGYRRELQNVLTKSIFEPYQAPAVEPAKKCSWDKFEGNDVVAAKIQIKKWKSEGRKLTMEMKKPNGAGLCGVADESQLTEGTSVSIASYICQ